MKPYKTIGVPILGIAALCAVENGQALNLGSAQGVAYLGQAVRLTVPLQFQAGDDRQSLCLDAEVFYGDRRVDGRLVSITADANGAGTTGHAQLTASQPVDEPVVTVFVLAGCTQKLGRRYLLLAEPAREPLSLPAPVERKDLVSTDKPRLAVPTENEPAPGGHSAVAAPAKSVSKVMKPVAVAPGPTVAIQPRPRPERRKQETVRRDVAEPVLKFSGVLDTGTENADKRAEAAALWRAANMSEQDVTQAVQRQDALQRDLSGLQQAVTQNQKTVQTLGQKLERAQSERYANPVVYTLVGACAVSVVGLLMLWRRRARVHGETPSWRDEVQRGAVESGQAVKTDARPAQMPVHSEEPLVPKKVASPRIPAVDIDIQLDDDTEGDPATAAVMASAASTASPSDAGQVAKVLNPGVPDFAHSTSASLRALNTREMLDIRQQAEFFMTLGQQDEALSLLRDHIGTSLESNPLVYLDLLTMLHNLGRRAEYEHYRAEFNSLFSGRVPAYGALKQNGRGLDEYPAICDQIAVLWPTGDAVAYIEQCLVLNQSAVDHDLLDLEAFRDLLMLHGVLRRMESGDETGMAPFSAVKEVPPPAHSDDLDLDITHLPGNLIEFDVSSFHLDDKEPKRTNTDRQ